MSYEWNRVQFAAQARQSSGQADTAQHGFTQLLPAAALRPFIAHYEILSVNKSAPIADLMLCALPQLDFLTSGSWTIDNQYSLRGIIFHGPQSRAKVFQSSGSLSFSVALTPLGLQMLGVHCAEALADRVEPAKSLLGCNFETLLNALRAAPSTDAKADVADAFFIRMLGHAKTTADPVLAALGQWISDPDAISVEAMCARLGVSHSKLGRLCRRYFGFTPKFLLRRARFCRMLDQLNLQPYRDWPTFLDPRYVDQSHFIRDFHAFMGMTPSGYLALPRPLSLARLHEQQVLDCFAQQRMAA